MGENGPSKAGQTVETYVVVPEDRIDQYSGFVKNLEEEGLAVKFLKAEVTQSQQDKTFDDFAAQVSSLGQSWTSTVALITFALSVEQSKRLGDALDSSRTSDGGEPYLAVAVHYSPLCLPSRSSGQHLGRRNIFHGGADQTQIIKMFVNLDQQAVTLAQPFEAENPNPRIDVAPPGGTRSDVKAYTYPNIAAQKASGDAPHWGVCLPFSSNTRLDAFRPDVGEWERSAAGMSYTRTLDAIKWAIGPRFDLENLWEAHTYHEFADRDSTKTMKTMVPEPYVNHVSTMTGGSGFGALEHFYRNNFVTRSPPDTELLPVSRTVGSDRIVDEMVFRCTHTCEIDYFLPGIEPTGKRLEIPMVGIVNFRGDKLSFESLYWDQASALAQIGILDPSKVPAIAGHQVVKKVLDPYGQPSNTLFAGGSAERATAPSSQR